LHPDLAPGDGQVGVMPGRLRVVTDQVDDHERRLPAGGRVLAPQPAVFEIPLRESQLGQLAGDFRLGIDPESRVCHGGAAPNSFVLAAGLLECHSTMPLTSMQGPTRCPTRAPGCWTCSRPVRSHSVTSRSRRVKKAATTSTARKYSSTV